MAIQLSESKQIFLIGITVFEYWYLLAVGVGHGIGPDIRSNLPSRTGTNLSSFATNREFRL
jgi:hypothetical protein